ncbi:hypothetical protein LAB1_50980 [Roseibium sp. LAB1]
MVEASITKTLELSRMAFSIKPILRGKVPAPVADREEAAIVGAHLVGDEIIEQGVERQDQIGIPLAVHRKIVDFLRIHLEIIKLDVIVAKQGVERGRRVEIERREIPVEPVAPVIDAARRTGLENPVRRPAQHRSGSVRARRPDP